MTKGRKKKKKTHENTEDIRLKNGEAWTKTVKEVEPQKRMKTLRRLGKRQQVFLDKNSEKSTTEDENHMTQMSMRINQIN